MWSRRSGLVVLTWAGTKAVTSYTEPSMMTHTLSGVLCACTSAAVRSRFCGPNGRAVGGARRYAI